MKCPSNPNGLCSALLGRIIQRLCWLAIYFDVVSQIRKAEKGHSWGRNSYHQWSDLVQHDTCHLWPQLTSSLSDQEVVFTLQPPKSCLSYRLQTINSYMFCGMNPGLSQACFSRRSDLFFGNSVIKGKINHFIIKYLNHQAKSLVFLSIRYGKTCNAWEWELDYSLLSPTVTLYHCVRWHTAFTWNNGFSQLPVSFSSIPFISKCPPRLD